MTDAERLVAAHRSHEGCPAAYCTECDLLMLAERICRGKVEAEKIAQSRGYSEEGQRKRARAAEERVAELSKELERERIWHYEQATRAEAAEAKLAEAEADWKRLSQGTTSASGCVCGKYPDLGDGVGMRDGHGDHVAHTRPGYGVTCETVVYRLQLAAAESREKALREALIKASHALRYGSGDYRERDAAEADAALAAGKQRP